MLTPWDSFWVYCRARIPSFSDLIIVDRLHSALVANLNGEQFISDPQTPLRQDDSMLILSADAGG